MKRNKKKSDWVVNLYNEIFGDYTPRPSEPELSCMLNDMVDRRIGENFNAETLKLIHGCIDVTTLTTVDTKEAIKNMVDKILNTNELMRQADIPNVAAICVYPLFVDTVKQALTTNDVKIASVSGGFPSSQTFTEIKIAETVMAVKAGAEEIDVVMNVGYFMEGDYKSLTYELSAIKTACQAAKLKVILETGALATTENIRIAALLALFGGADFIKTSTGKGYPGATPEAVYTMCQIIKTYAKFAGRKAGIKISGGIQTAEDAVRYYTIVKEVLGQEWLNKDLFRIGASKLTDDIQSILLSAK